LPRELAEDHADGLRRREVTLGELLILLRTRDIDAGDRAARRCSRASVRMSSSGGTVNM
jgi:hypothetical protein